MRFFKKFLLIALLCLFHAVPELSAQSISVSNINDSGVGSLRQAIIDANSNSNQAFITFNIPGVGPHVINPISQLPDITTPVVIDALGSNTTPGTIILSGNCTGCNNLNNGLVFKPGSSGSIVKGLSITKFKFAYINIAANGITIEKNYLGIQDNVRSSYGVYAQDASDIIISGNKIANSNEGIELFRCSGFFTIDSNYIGMDITGSVEKGGSDAAIIVGGDGSSAQIDKLTVKDNLFSGLDAGFKVIEEANVVDLEIINNKIGTNAAGTSAIGSTNQGPLQPMNVGIGIVPNSVMQFLKIEGNLVAGYENVGLAIENFQNTQCSTVIRNNKLGVNFNEDNVLYPANVYYDILISDISTISTGKSTLIENNICGGGKIQGSAIAIYCNTPAHNVIVTGNFLGVKRDGITSLNNTVPGHGMEVYYGNDITVENNKIGYLKSGIFTYSTLDSMNVRNNNIHHNQLDGIQVNEANNVTISENSIFANSTQNGTTSKAINLNYTTANQGNTGKQPPLNFIASGLTVTGTSVIGDIIEAFTSDGPQNALTFVSSTTADGSGNWSITVPGVGDYVFTATDVNGNTSELSAPFTVLPVPTCDCTPPPGYANCVKVTNTDDPAITDINGSCGSLRWAILKANQNTGGTYVTFEIPGSGEQTIELNMSLPTITSKVFIDGFSQSNGTNEHLITLRPSADYMSSIYTEGINLNTSNSTIKGLRVEDFYWGILAEGSDLEFADNVFFNTQNFSHTNDFRFWPGFIKVSGGTNIIVHGNIMDWNINDYLTDQGIYFSNVDNFNINNNRILNSSHAIVIYDSKNFVIDSNIIGTNLTGTEAKSVVNGISIDTYISDKMTIKDNLISAANPINIHSQSILSPTATKIEIINNKIGTDFTGNQALGSINRTAGLAPISFGILLFLESGAHSVLVEQNLISGYTGYALQCRLNSVNDSVFVRSNKFGVDFLGENLLFGPNYTSYQTFQPYDVAFVNIKGYVLFGGSEGNENICGGGGYCNWCDDYEVYGGGSVEVYSDYLSKTEIIGNYIGVNKNGEKFDKSDPGVGIELDPGVGIELEGYGEINIKNNEIGYFRTGIYAIPFYTNPIYYGSLKASIKGNNIHHNLFDGINVDEYYGITISENKIAYNGISDANSKAINLNYGINDSDPYVYSEGNKGKSFPQNLTYSALTVTGSAVTSGDIIEAFTSDGPQNALTFVSTTTADGSGNWSITVPGAGDYVFTSTDVNGNTSELSTSLNVPPLPTCDCTPPPGYANCVKVTNTDDPAITDINGSCGSLRWAILKANQNTGGTYIMFDIPGSGEHIIELNMSLPFITSKVFIDALGSNLQPGNIIISGNYTGLVFNSGSAGSSVKGLSMTSSIYANNFYILITNTENITVEKNYLGEQNQSDGLRMTDGVQIDQSANITIRDNRIANFQRAGISSFGSTGNLIIEGNYIGTDITGSQEKGGGGYGIWLIANNQSLLGQNVVIQDNVLSGYYGIGVNYDSNGPWDIKILNNKIGTDVAGNNVIGSSVYSPSFNYMWLGIDIEQTNAACIIEGNLIAGYERVGILTFKNSSPVIIRNNKIGVNQGEDNILYANVNLANVKCWDIMIDRFSTFPGTNIIENNICGGGINRSAIYFDSYRQTSITSNYIGVRRDGVTSLNNLYAKYGIEVLNGNDINIKNNSIGYFLTGIYTYPGLGKLSVKNNNIHDNQSDGIQVNGGDEVTISQNSITDNENKAINLNYGTGSQGNNGKQPPLNLTYSGFTIIGTGVISGDIIEAFTSDGPQNALTFVSSTTADASGNWSISVPGAGVYVFTATDANGNTSELSAPFTVPLACGLIVTNTNNAGSGSLRSAIECANSNPDPSTITFNISGATQHTIAVSGNKLPDIFTPVHINGFTQTGASLNNYKIKLISDASLTTNENVGLSLISGSANSTIEGLEIFNFRIGINVLNSANNIIANNNINTDKTDGSILFGIQFDGSDNSVIKSNKIGVDATGLIATGDISHAIIIRNSTNVIVGGDLNERNHIVTGSGVTFFNVTSSIIKGNLLGIDANENKLSKLYGYEGILISNGSKNNIIENNIIGASGNGNATKGILVEDASTEGNIIKGNLIGINSFGNLVPFFYGILFDGSTKNNTVGGLLTGEYNVIAGNFVSGVESIEGTFNTKILGNRIGTDKDGMIAKPNGTGIILRGMNNEVTGNVISGSLSNGMNLHARESIVKNNFIGTNINGTSTIPNGRLGIWLTGINNIIGGGANGSNIISGNGGHGIEAVGGNNTISGNKIGTDITGNVAMGNKGYGIFIKNSGNKIGGSISGEGNIIANNVQGINIESANKNLISTNSIFNNNGSHIPGKPPIQPKAINLNQGPTKGNNGKKWPKALSYINYIVTGTSAPGDIVEAFSSNGPQNALAYKGSATANGAGAWIITVPGAGNYVFTATDVNNNTSELSPPFKVPFSCAYLSAPVILTPGGTHFCSGKSLVLTTELPYAKYQWTRLDGSPVGITRSVTITQGGTYKVSVEDTNKCTATSAPVIITEDPIVPVAVPAFTLFTFCENKPLLTGHPTTLRVDNPVTGISYEWDLNSDGNAEVITSNAESSFTFTQAGQYKITLTARIGCSSNSKVATVDVIEFAIKSALGKLCKGHSTTLDVTPSDLPADDYIWYKDDTRLPDIGPSLLVTEHGRYSVVIKSFSCVIDDAEYDDTPGSSSMQRLNENEAFASVNGIMSPLSEGNHLAFSQFLVIERICPTLGCGSCISPFRPQPGKSYLVSVWVKEEHTAFVENYDQAGIKFDYHIASGTTITIDNTHLPLKVVAGSPFIEGWQKIEGLITIPANTIGVTISLISSTESDVLYDDVRIQPVDGSMKSFVYDPLTMRLMSELDENNYATYYEYDQEGKLIRIKKETERGIMTIQESQNNTYKKP